MMKVYTLLLSAFCICSACLAQPPINRDSIQICYKQGADGMGGQDHCVKIWFENDSIFCQRICYSKLSYINIIKSIDTAICYEEAQKQAILRHYQESNDYLILDECVAISQAQLNELVTITNEIKEFASKQKSDSDWIILNTNRIDYMIKDESGTAVIIDWYGRYNRYTDIEKVLGLKSYQRCPCVKRDMERMGMDTSLKKRKARPRNKRK